MSKRTESRANDLSAFLRDLAALCLRYGYGIEGCGCQGTPVVVDRQGRVVYERLETRAK